MFDRCRLLESGPEALALVKRLMVKCYPDECLVDEEIAAYGKTMRMYETLEREESAGAVSFRTAYAAERSSEGTAA